MERAEPMAFEMRARKVSGSTSQNWMLIGGSCSQRLTAGSQ